MDCKRISAIQFEDSSHKGILKKVIFSKLELISATTQIAYSELIAGMEINEHFHDSMEEVFLILEGSCEFYMNGEIYFLEKEAVIKVNPKTPHKIKATSHLRFFYFGVAL